MKYQRFKNWIGKNIDSALRDNSPDWNKSYLAKLVTNQTPNTRKQLRNWEGRITEETINDFRQIILKHFNLRRLNMFDDVYLRNMLISNAAVKYNVKPYMIIKQLGEVRKFALKAPNLAVITNTSLRDLD